MAGDDALLQGDPRAGAFSIRFLREGRLVGVQCINAPRDFLQSRAAIARAQAA